jgi:hypothetical protein
VNHAPRTDGGITVKHVLVAHFVLDTAANRKRRSGEAWEGEDQQYFICVKAQYVEEAYIKALSELAQRAPNDAHKFMLHTLVCPIGTIDMSKLESLLARTPVEEAIRDIDKKTRPAHLHICKVTFGKRAVKALH